jgi:hypothetical protein
MRSARSLCVVAVAAWGVGLVPAGTALAAPPGVARDQASVAQITKSNDHLAGAGFAIDAAGHFATTVQAASRTTGYEVDVRGSRMTQVSRVPSDAIPGIQLLRVRPAPQVPALRFAARTPPIGSPVWIVPPAPTGSPLAGRLFRPYIGCSRSTAAGVLRVSHVAPRAGIVGSPVVDRSGAVLGLVRSVNPAAASGGRGCVAGAAIQVLLANKAPSPLPFLPPPKRANFPAKMVAIMIGGLLVLINCVVFLARRARFASARHAAVATKATPDPSLGAGLAGPSDFDDELQHITFKSRPAAAAPPPPDDDLDAIRFR